MGWRALPFLLLACLAGCLEPNVDRDADGAPTPDRSKDGLEILFGSITEDGAWAVFDHVDGPCLSIAAHEWKLTDGAGREHDAEPLVWEDSGGPHPGGPSEWCAGERRVFDAEDSGVARLRIVNADGGTVAIIDGPGPFDAAFNRDEAEDRISVVRAESSADWNRLAIEASTMGTSVRLVTGPSPESASAHVSDPDVTKGFQRLAASPRPMETDDSMTFCSDDGETTTVTYTVADLWSNTIIYVTTFQDIATCD
jgi:hypothetical protein